MKPKPHTIQWIAPHLSEGELKALYELILDRVIGEDYPYLRGQEPTNALLSINYEKDLARKAATTLFGRDNK